jgi:hypothetical protein
VMEDFEESLALDAGLLSGAQAVEHYEMARHFLNPGLRNCARPPRTTKRSPRSRAPRSVVILDVRLGRQTTEQAAEMLAAKGVLFVFYSGQALPESMRNKFPGAKVLTKPLNESAVVAAYCGRCRTLVIVRSGRYLSPRRG